MDPINTNKSYKANNLFPPFTSYVLIWLSLGLAGVRALWDVVMADPTGRNNIAVAAHILGQGNMASRHAAHFPGDLFYLLAVEIFGALRPLFHHFLWACEAFCVQWRPYPPVSIVSAFFGQWVSVALQWAQAFTLLCRAKAVGFRVSQKFIFMTPCILLWSSTMIFSLLLSRTLVLLLLMGSSCLLGSLIFLVFFLCFPP